MGSGDVLDFNNHIFAEFFHREVGIDINDDTFFDGHGPRLAYPTGFAMLADGRTHSNLLRVAMAAANLSEA
ncbi:MAG: hypothetical protein DI533_16865 [Cereibacter sphaeroides]|uniref:Uncharacterized protein n=1 Tax=Cereibacter sphaeroides TaxID=1063 RepID=A0A2W5S4Z7_CERSP|nr:MAG: hypothetical protein DI533_16865 [Cereibacter sphaeroides]